MRNRWPENVSLVEWQTEAFNTYIVHPLSDFLLVATPAAGKTLLALYVASHLLATGKVRRVVVLVPTEQLKFQWAAEAAAIGIDLDPGWKNGTGAVGLDYDGTCVTVAQVGANPDIHRFHCQIPTLVIIDEVHHIGESKAWGIAARHAFELATRRLSLSGTPFRSDGDPIVGVRYDASGLSLADFTYSYPQALDDGRCRPILFPTHEGRMKWYSRGNSHEATFRDKLNQDDSSRRRRTAVDSGGNWVREAFRAANRQLIEIRRGHQDCPGHLDAAGAVIAMSKWHAEQIGSFIKEETGEQPLVVTSDDADASRMIAGFARDRRPWIVAVKMVSEGVNIPRLRVGVYATNIATEMFFRQVVGRFVRMIPDLEDQNAYLFIPRDEELLRFAQMIAEERQHQLEKSLSRARAEIGGDDEGPGVEKMLSEFVFGSSSGWPDDVVVKDAVISQKEIGEAQSLRAEIGAPPSWDAAILARLIRKVKGGPDPSVGPSSSAPEPRAAPLHEQKKNLSKIIKQLVAMVVTITDEEYDYQQVYSDLINFDGTQQAQCTIKQLNARIDYLNDWIRRLTDGR